MAKTRYFTLNLTDCSTTYDVAAGFAGGTTQVIVITANDGFTFTGVTLPTPTFMNYDGYYSKPTVVVSDDGKTATYTFTEPDANITLTVAAVAGGGSTDTDITDKVTNKIENTTLQTATISGGDGGTGEIVLQTNTGYVFDPDTLPKVGYYNYDGDPVSTPATLSNDNKTATFTLSNVDTGETYALTGSVIAETPTGDYTITQILNYCTTDAPQYANRGDVLTITFTANDGYVFDPDSLPTVAYLNNDTGYTEVKKPTLASDNKTGTVTTGAIGGNVTIKATAVLPSAGVTIQTELKNCTGSIPATADAGVQLTFVLTANDGYTFDGTPAVSWYAEGIIISRPFTVSEDKLTATVTFTTPTDAEDNTITVYATATAVVPYSDKYGAINVYVVTNDNLTDFAKERYVKEVNSQTGEVIYNDLGDFVLKLHRVFAEIGTTKDAVIKAGRFTTAIDCQTPDNDVITTDFGTIDIPTPNNDITDLQNEIRLFLPFVGFVTLDTPTVNGKTIALQYETNIITGDAVARVTVDGVTTLLNGCKAIQDVLFRTYADKQVGQLDYNENVMQGLRPYVVIKYHDSHTVAPYNDNTRAIIGTFTGYCRFEDIAGLNADNMTRTEYNEIINLLNTGVYL